MRKRSTDILYYLIENHYNSYNIENLSKRYNVTLKTLQNDLKEINELLNFLNISMINVNKQGNLILENDFDRKKIKNQLDKMDFYTYKFSHEERQILIIAKLIQKEDYIRMSDIAEELFVSRITIINDIDSIKEILKEYNIELYSKRSRGIKLNYDEKDLRILLIDILKKVIKNVSCEGFFQRIIISILDMKYSISSIVELLKEFGEKYNVFFTDYIFYEIVISLFVILNRILKNCNICHVEEDVNIDDTDKIMNFFEEKLQLKITDKERIYYELYLNKNTIVPTYRKNGNTQLFTAIINFLEKIEKAIPIELHKDTTLVESLVQHINSIKDWTDKDLELEFNVTGSMEQDFYRILEEVNKYSYILEEFLNYDLDSKRKESIVVHICASLIRNRVIVSPLNVLIVCPGSMATGKLIEAQIKNYYHFNIKAIISANKLFTDWDFEHNKIDLIISTINIVCNDIPVINVNPLLSIEDLNKIQQIAFKLERSISNPISEDKRRLMKEIGLIVNNIESQDKLNELRQSIEKVTIAKNSLKYLLDKNNIVISDEKLGWEESMYKSAQILLNKGYITKEYIHKAIENVHEWGPYIILSKGTALVHASQEDGVNDEAISLFVSKQGVLFEGEVDPVHLFFCFCTKGDIDYMDLFKDIINISKNDVKITGIIESNTTSEVYETIFSDMI